MTAQAEHERVLIEPRMNPMLSGSALERLLRKRRRLQKEVVAQKAVASARAARAHAARHRSSLRDDGRRRRLLRPRRADRRGGGAAARVRVRRAAQRVRGRRGRPAQLQGAIQRAGGDDGSAARLFAAPASRRAVGQRRRRPRPDGVGTEQAARKDRRWASCLPRRAAVAPPSGTTWWRYAPSRARRASRCTATRRF